MFTLLSGCYINYLLLKIDKSTTGVYHMLHNYYLIAIRQGIIDARKSEEWDEEINVNMIGIMFEKYGHNKETIGFKSAVGLISNDNTHRVKKKFNNGNYSVFTKIFENNYQ